MAASAQVFDELHGATLAIFFRRDAITLVFQHRQSMQWNVRTAPGVRGWRQVVGIRFARDLQHADGDALRHFRTASEPLAIGPRLNHFFGQRITLVSFFFDVMELVKHQQGFLQTSSSNWRARFVVEQIDQRREVVPAEHGAQKFSGFFSRQQRTFFSAVRHSR